MKKYILGIECLMVEHSTGINIRRAGVKRLLSFPVEGDDEVDALIKMNKALANAADKIHTPECETPPGSITISLTPAFRDRLEKAAKREGTTPEVLACFALMERVDATSKVKT